MESVTLTGRWWNRIALPLAPRQRVGAWLGKLDEAGRLGVQRAADVARYFGCAECTRVYRLWYS